MQDIAFAMAATDDDMNFEMPEMPTFSLGLDFFGDDTEQQSVPKADQADQNLNNFAFPLEKNSSKLKYPPLASKQNLPQQQQQQNGSQESKFTNIVPPQRSGESNTRVFSFKSSTAATVMPFNKGTQNSTTNPQNIVKKLSNSSTMCNSTNSSSDGRLIKNIGFSGDNSIANTWTSTDKENCQTNWCLDTSDHRRNLNNTTSTPNSTTKNIPKAFVSVSTMNILFTRSQPLPFLHVRMLDEMAFH